MCNLKHKVQIKQLKNEGHAWKIFTVEDSRFYPMVPRVCIYDSNDWNTWNEELYREVCKHIRLKPNKGIDKGFCCFKTKREAVEALKIWKCSCSNHHYRIKKILYKGVVSHHLEKNFVFPNVFRIMLVKKFKIL